MGFIIMFPQQGIDRGHDEEGEMSSTRTMLVTREGVVGEQGDQGAENHRDQNDAANQQQGTPSPS